MPSPLYVFLMGPSEALFKWQNCINMPTPPHKISTTLPNFIQNYDETNHHPAVPCESERGRPSENPPVVSGGSPKFTADPDETHKKVAKGGQGEGYHPDTGPGPIGYCL